MEKKLDPEGKLKLSLLPENVIKMANAAIQKAVLALVAGKKIEDTVESVRGFACFVFLKTLYVVLGARVVNDDGSYGRDCLLVVRLGLSFEEKEKKAGKNSSAINLDEIDLFNGPALWYLLSQDTIYETAQLFKLELVDLKAGDSSVTYKAGEYVHADLDLKEAVKKMTFTPLQFGVSVD